MSRKTVYYHDPLHDDFAPTNGRIHPKQIGADFPYEHDGPLWNALAFVVYRMVMTPFLFLYCKLVFGLRIENRKALRALPGGYFLYGNHTNTLADAFIPTLLAFPRRANIITSADTVSIPGVRNIVQMLGAIPLANTIEGTRQFLAAMHRRLERGQAVTIYPEAHIWLFYTGIRPFPAASFGYPARDGAPVYAMTSCYRKRRFGAFPKVVTYLDGPYFPDMSLPLPERKQKLRDQCHTAMVRRAEENSTYVYYEYREEA